MSECIGLEMLLSLATLIVRALEVLPGDMGTVNNGPYILLCKFTRQQARETSGDCKDFLAGKGLDNNPWVGDITWRKHDVLLCYNLSFFGDWDQGVGASQIEMSS